MDNSRLRSHLLREHGRTGRDIAGLPLAHLHRFEHVELAMGLISLRHRHSANGPSQGGRRARGIA
jgi:hypothetical protein